MSEVQRLSSAAMSQLRIIFDEVLTEPTERLQLLEKARKGEMTFDLYYDPLSQCGCVWGSAAIIARVFVPTGDFDTDRAICGLRNKIMGTHSWALTTLETELHDGQTFFDRTTACAALEHAIEKLIDSDGEIRVTQETTE